MFDWVLNTPIVSTIKCHTLYLQKFGPLEKADPEPWEKVDPMPKFTILVKNTFMANYRLLISNMTTIFLKNYGLKTPKSAIFDPKNKDF